MLHAGNGPDALALASVHHPDLLLTDVVMPQMSGPQLHEHIRHRHPGLPVLYMTGYSDGLLAPHPTPEHGAHVIRKPFSEPDLLRHVSAALANTTPDRLHRPSNGR